MEASSTVKSTTLATLQHTQSGGWSSPLPRHLDTPSTLVLVAGASGYWDKPGALHELRQALPRSIIVGCSTSGEIFGPRLFDDSLSVGVLRFEHTALRRADAPVRTPADSFRAGEHLARQLEGPDLRGVLVLSDGLHVNGSELVGGLSSVLPDSVVVTGGLGGDGARFQRTWVLRGDGPASNLVCAVGLYGPRVRIGHGSRGGWDAFGLERTVTRSTGNVLYELDGKPALDIYKSYLGDRASGLPATALLFPLTIRDKHDAGKMLVRTVLSVSEQDKSMTFAGDIPEGSRAQMMRANFDRLVTAASESARLSAHAFASCPATLTLAVSCVGRRLVLGERTEEELEAIQDVLPAGGGLVGFYSYGELSPFASGRCDLHNQTMTLTTLGEDPA